MIQVFLQKFRNQLRLGIQAFVDVSRYSEARLISYNFGAE